MVVEQPVIVNFDKGSHQKAYRRKEPSSALWIANDSDEETQDPRHGIPEYPTNEV